MKKKDAEQSTKFKIVKTGSNKTRRQYQFHFKYIGN